MRFPLAAGYESVNCRMRLHLAPTQEMNANELPLNQSVEFFRDDVLRATITRISAVQVEMRYYSQATSDQVLKVVAGVDGVAPSTLDLADLDTVFWSISIDGHAATRRDLEDVVKRQSSFAVDNKSRLSLSLREEICTGGLSRLDVDLGSRMKSVDCGCRLAGDARLARDFRARAPAVEASSCGASSRRIHVLAA